jgi:hypothetical protein
MYGLALLKIRPDTESFEAHPFTAKTIKGSNILSFMVVSPSAGAASLTIAEAAKDCPDHHRGSHNKGERQKHPERDLLPKTRSIPTSDFIRLVRQA